ncbi:MAG: MoaD/ThiS family protein [Bacillota bacterium]
MREEKEGLQVYLGVLLARQSRFAPAANAVQLPAGACRDVADLLAYLGLSPTLIGMVVVNGQRAGLDTPLPEEGQVYLFPCLAGG